MIIRFEDIMASGHCARGTRRWFNDHGLDFRDFMANGIEEEKFLATKDGLAIQVVDATRKRKGIISG